MRGRVSTKQGRQQKGIGADQLRNVRVTQQLRDLEGQLHEMGYSDADIARLIKEQES